MHSLRSLASAVIAFVAIIARGGAANVRAAEHMRRGVAAAASASAT